MYSLILVHKKVASETKCLPIIITINYQYLYWFSDPYNSLQSLCISRYVCFPLMKVETELTVI